MAHPLSRKQLDEFLLKVVLENNRMLREIHHMLHELAETPPVAVAMHIEIRREIQGENIMSASFVVGQTIVATPVETDAAGKTVAIADPTLLTWTISDPTIASGVASPDGTFTCTALAAGTATVTVTDPANSLSATDTLTVTAAASDTATALKIEWGTPVTKG